jgi:ankyrin repeat protein
VNARMRHHWTPILVSAGNGYLGIVKLLLERGADVRALSPEGETPYELSLAYGHREISDLLREHGTGNPRFEEIFLWLKCDA